MICYLNIHQKTKDSQYSLRFKAFSKIVELKMRDLCLQNKVQKTCCIA